MRVVALATTAFAAALPSASRADAQTAPAVLTCEVDNADPLTGAQVAVNCRLVSYGGAPFPGAGLIFMLTFEGGTDAWFDGGTKAGLKTTDDRGRLTIQLNAGERPGVLGVLVNSPGIRSSFHVINVAPAPPPPE